LLVRSGVSCYSPTDRHAVGPAAPRAGEAAPSRLQGQRSRNGEVAAAAPGGCAGGAGVLEAEEGREEVGEEEKKGVYITTKGGRTCSSIYMEESDLGDAATSRFSLCLVK
jgi:hypothetical protein